MSEQQAGSHTAPSAFSITALSSNLWVCDSNHLTAPDYALLQRRLRLGTLFGIDLFVHWTFGFLVAYVVAMSVNEGAREVVYRLLCLLGVFTCVTLHEYGHALAARAFGIPTIDITLLPIGGVARLKQMPRIPWQELVVAVAGPAVNVIIFTVLSGGMLAYFLISPMVVGGANPLSVGQGNHSLMTLDQILGTPSVTGFLFTMLFVNVMLVIFNMIPAFPMDGGRVLRSFLAMMMNYRRATFVASRIGLTCGVMMAFLAFNYGVWQLGLIAAFIAFAGMNEARQVDVMESVRGIKLTDVLIRQPPFVLMDTPIGTVASMWETIPMSAIPVTSAIGTVTGMVGLKELGHAISQQVAPSTPVGQIANRSVHPAQLEEKLETIILSANRHHRVIPVVDKSGRLVGVLDLDTIVSRGALEPLRSAWAAASLGREGSSNEPHARFDAFS